MRINMVGQRFGRLTVLRDLPDKQLDKVMRECVCDCGAITKSTRSNSVNSKHGHAGPRTSTYAIWVGMIARCHNPNNANFFRYGGRGISVCESWRKSFISFLKDMGEHPSGMTLERKNNDLGYSLDNCVWATQKQQANNTRSNRLVTISGVTKTLMQWIEANEKSGSVSEKTYSRVWRRIKRGWPPERAITEKVIPSGRWPSDPYARTMDENKSRGSAESEGL